MTFISITGNSGGVTHFEILFYLIFASIIVPIISIKHILQDKKKRALTNTLNAVALLPAIAPYGALIEDLLKSSETISMLPGNASDIFGEMLLFSMFLYLPAVICNLVYINKKTN